MMLPSVTRKDSLAKSLQSIFGPFLSEIHPKYGSDLVPVSAGLFGPAEN